MYDRNHYFGLGPILKPKLAVTYFQPKYAVTDTETTYQRLNLVAISMGNFSNHKGTPKTLLTNTKYL